MNDEVRATGLDPARGNARKPVGESPAQEARGQRDRDLQQWVQKFATRLEHHCRERPFNWFNFYDFWGQRP